MDRIELIQGIIDNNSFINYLEIGTHNGTSFFPMRCKNKIAVDPNFQYSKKRKLKWHFKNFNNWNNQFFANTSDEFFLKHKNALTKTPPDIALIDGLHTYHQALVDVLNTLEYLNSNGVIVMHDCYPPHEAASTYGTSFEDAEKNCKEGWTTEWCGDVWKSIAYLRKKYVNELDVCVIDIDYGLGIVRKKDKNSIPTLIDQALFNDIQKLEYSDMEVGKNELLGLQNIDFAHELISNLHLAKQQ